MNRFRKTGTYIKQDNLIDALGPDTAARSGFTTAAVDPEINDYGGYGDEYEGGELEEPFPDIDNDLAK